ncbi:sensor histidine kinase [Halobaculum sp. MBLA0143]|uniref:sensor histidine kinase n=1 Tax=Halobaculum sp. MBLA0143 TaxID=3079933 RepID=UPI0035248401
MTGPDERVDGLATVTSQLADCEDETAVAWTLVESLDTVVDFDAAVVYERGDGRLQPLATAADELHTGPALSGDAGVAGRVLRRGEAEVTDDLTTTETGRDPGRFRAALTAPVDDDRGLQLLSTEPGAYGTAALSAVRVVCSQAECVLQRVTARDRARREADEFAVLFENVPDPTLRYEVREGVPVVDEVNAALLSQFDTTVETVVGAPLEAVVGGGTVDESQGRGSDDTLRGPGAGGTDETRPPEWTAARRGERAERRVDRQTADGTRRFLVRTVPGRPDAPTQTGTGYVIYVDIEASRRREQMAVLNRFLRHNVRNDVSVVRAYLEQIERAVDDTTVTEYAAAAVSTADKLQRRSRKARTAQELVDSTTNENRTRFDLERIVRKQAAAVGEEFPDVDLTVAVEPDDPPTVIAHERLPLAVGEVLENAATHAGDAPTVRVTVTATDATGAVTVADDGPGVPRHETQVIDSGAESQLEHGRGIGLWLVAWITDASEGELTVTRPGEGGTVLRLSVPSVDAAEGATR